MSRLIVKNLPKSVTEDKIRELFSQKGIVTDVQLKYTKDGVFRHFGFVGYKTVEQAQEAIQHFNNTRIKSNKISVEECAALGDENKPKSWSKYATDSTAFKKANQKEEDVVKVDKKKAKKEKKKKIKEEIQEAVDKHKDDPLFKEFVEAHARKDLKAIWNNDTVTNETSKKESELNDSDEGDEIEQESEKIQKENSEKSNSDSENEDEEKIADKDISDKEYLKALIKDSTEQTLTKPRQKMEKKKKEQIQLYTVKVKGLAYTTKKKDIKSFFSPLKPYTIRLPPKTKGFAYVGFKTEKEMKRALNKDRGFISDKQINVFEYHKQGAVEEQTNTGNEKWKQQQDSLKNVEDIAESGRLFVINLAYSTTEDELQKLFETYGPVSEVNLPIDRITRKLKGFGLVTFMMPEHAIKAYNALDGTVFCGRMLHLLPGKAKDSSDDIDENLTFKEKKQLKLKKTAGSSHNWNTLFMGQNAVAELIAKDYGTTKDAVLGDNAAVRLALGETQIVTDMTKFLKESGICLESFNEPPKKRSKTIIIAKNLPADTKVSEVISVFKNHGLLGRVVLPPSGVTAVIEFLEPSEARHAFAKLAYSKFKSVPLYLEWAPENTFVDPTPIPNINNGKTDLPEISNKEDIPVEEEADDEDPEENTTLFIKNLNFETREDAVRQHFKRCGKIHTINIATKRDPYNPGQKLSMGYGFIQFKTKSSTEYCLKNMQQTQLDGKSLELKRSDRVLQSQVQSSKKTVKHTENNGTKILVRNVPFQANKGELEQLFKTFGEIKALRLPKKMTPGEDTHRGFAFVDYHTKSDAKQAFEALSQSTHLYGRRLVLEWAAAEESVDDIRKRTAKHFHADEIKKSKKAVFGDI